MEPESQYITYNCFLCSSPFTFGPHRYDGKYIKYYQIMICNTCKSASWDGLAPHDEQKIKAHLEKLGLDLPERNEKGWLPIDP
jgi:hypothetical protein